ncbi:MAG: hypothetical protein PHN29_06550, partial [Endomicrobiaceae bacterium]|nr:hypothetical protein [Endomicrobiaceae bacterium]
MIKKIIQITSAAQSYRKVEFSVDLNPFINDINRYDYDELTLTGIFQAPDGRKLKQAAFFYQEYARMQNDIFGEITKQGAPHFRFRFTPDMAGWWTLTVRVFPLPSEDVTALFYVKQGGRPNRGIIRVDRVSNRFFIDAAGKTFIPIGCNLAWYTKRNGLVDYQRWLAALQANNMNITRVWLAPWTFALHSNHYADFTQALERLYRLDWLMENAERQGVYIILTLLNHGQFSTKINPTWNENPWNEINGGPLQYPIDFFISPEAKRIYKSQLRYIIARYGYAAQIFAWELINEIDHIDDYQAYRDQVTLWQQEMAAFIREIDSYCHLVTTSYYSEFGPAFKLREIDFVAAHSYDYADLDIYQAAPLKINEAYRQY